MQRHMAYKIDILKKLKENGYNTNRLRKEKLLAEGVIQALRDDKSISWKNIERICDLLMCEPGDILVMVDSEGRDADGFLRLSRRQRVGMEDDG